MRGLAKLGRFATTLWMLHHHRKVESRASFRPNQGNFWMFEELAVWRRIDRKAAVRYVGFRNLETGWVWIALANHIAIEKDRDLSADELMAADGTLESFLNAFPSDVQVWKPTISEAVAIFREQHAGT